MPYRDLRDFMGQLEAAGELRHIAAPVAAQRAHTWAFGWRKRLR